MGYMYAIGYCVSCRVLFHFNVDRCPSVRVHWENGQPILDPNGAREPLCRSCAEEINRNLVREGLVPFPIPADAYEAEEVQ